MVDWNKFNQELRNVIDTGKLIYGTNEIKKECLVGDPKLLILSSTIDNNTKEIFLHYAKLLNINAIEYPENSLELGSVCAKPFSISVVAVIDLGKSSIMDVINEKDTDTKENKKVIAKKAKKEEKKVQKETKKAKSEETKKVKATDDMKVEDKEVPITEDKFFKDIIKIKKNK
ncbi:MAG: 50S ribosomal protein L30e [Candidatus ainarchaeum sp.]|jgi:large subunit ribosomal protein L30e|nr:50S ribosomal protein L30e [Candidatus ainarchaeum sp.]